MVLGDSEVRALTIVLSAVLSAAEAWPIQCFSLVSEAVPHAPIASAFPKMVA